MHGKILYQEFLRYALFLRYGFCIWMRKKIEPYYFFVSFHTNSAINISSLAARYKIFGVNADSGLGGDAITRLLQC